MKSTDATLRRQLKQFYEERNPLHATDERIGLIIEKYQGKTDILWKELYAKYPDKIAKPLERNIEKKKKQLLTPEIQAIPESQACKNLLLLLFFIVVAMVDRLVKASKLCVISISHSRQVANRST